jgi:hypothetical protein
MTRRSEKLALVASVTVAPLLWLVFILWLTRKP